MTELADNNYEAVALHEAPWACGTESGLRGLGVSRINICKCKKEKHGSMDGKQQQNTKESIRAKPRWGSRGRSPRKLGGFEILNTCNGLKL